MNFDQMHFSKKKCMSNSFSAHLCCMLKQKGLGMTEKVFHTFKIHHCIHFYPDN